MCLLAFQGQIESFASQTVGRRVRAGGQITEQHGTNQQLKQTAALMRRSVDTK